MASSISKGFSGPMKMNVSELEDSRTSRKTGKLQEQSSRFLIQKLHQSGFSGYLLLQLRDKKKKIWFSQGEIIRIQSNLIPELFGHMMVERGWITEEDLKTCLKLQRDMVESTQSAKRIGDWVQELYSISEDELAELYQIQKINSILQSMTWDEGVFEMVPLDVKTNYVAMVGLKDVVRSIEMLFDTQGEGLGPLFRAIRPWQPKSQAVDLAKTPLWAMLAGCQLTLAHGILSIRKHNKLYEIVIKNGIPLLLYEGTFGQPRQTVIVRQTSEEHERFFVDQVFRLFSFLTGSAHFRVLGSFGKQKERDSFLQILEAEREDVINLSEDSEEKQTQVTQSLQPDEDEVPFELKSHFLARQTGLLKKTLGRFVSLMKKSA